MGIRPMVRGTSLTVVGLSASWLPNSSSRTVSIPRMDGSPLEGDGSPLERGSEYTLPPYSA